MANYTLCELRSWTCPTCSTSFWVSGTTGGHMQSNCDDPADDDRYDRTYPDAPTDPSHDWKNLANEWRLAIDLNGGLTKNNASNARILTSLALLEPRLPGGLPSMAEGLAVLASSTLVAGSLQTTFRHYWQEGPAVAPHRAAAGPARALQRHRAHAGVHIDPPQPVAGHLLRCPGPRLPHQPVLPGLLPDAPRPRHRLHRALRTSSPSPSTRPRAACSPAPAAPGLAAATSSCPGVLPMRLARTTTSLTRRASPRGGAGTAKPSSPPRASRTPWCHRPPPRCSP